MYRKEGKVRLEKVHKELGPRVQKEVKEGATARASEPLRASCCTSQPDSVPAKQTGAPRR